MMRPGNSEADGLQGLTAGAMIVTLCAMSLSALAQGFSPAGRSDDAKLEALRAKAAEGKLDAMGASQLAAEQTKHDKARREAVADLAAGLEARLNGSTKNAAACFQCSAKCPEAIAAADALLRPAYLSLDAMIKAMPAGAAERATRPCPLCGGTGLLDCTKCRGLGYGPCSQCKGLGTISLASNITPRTCPYCRGAGEDRCSDCSGKGTLTCKCGKEPLVRKASGTSEYLSSDKTAAIGQALNAFSYLGLVALEIYGSRSDACQKPSPAAGASAPGQSAPEGTKPLPPPRSHTMPKGAPDHDKATGLPRGKSVFD